MTTCGDVLRHLNLFLDSECDPETNLAVSEHLATCAACAERLAREKRLEDRIAAGLGAGEPGDAEMWRTLRAKAVRRPAFRRWALAAGFLLAAAVGIVLFASRHGASDLVRTACADHGRMLEGAHAPEVITPSWKDAAAGLRGRLPFSLSFSGEAPAGLVLVGGRACAFKTHPVALFSAQLAGRPVSVAVLPVSALGSFPEAAGEFDRKGDAFVCGDGAYRVGLARRDGLLVCVTGDAEGAALGETAFALAESLKIAP